ncbi:MAG: sodium:solute symporter family protein, partial [Myxococcota bacterium]
MSNLLTLDFAIVAIYLLVTLAVGLYYGKGITTMKQYVIGDRKRYSTGVLVATLFATLVGGGSTIGQSERVFALGVIWCCVALGDPIEKYLIARHFAPCMPRFRSKLSVGAMMGGFYGKIGRIITGIFSA